MYDGGGLVVEMKKSYILKSMKNKPNVNIAQLNMQFEKMLNTMQLLFADAAYAGSSEMSLDEINAEIEAARDGLINQEKKKSFSLHPYKKLYFKAK